MKTLIIALVAMSVMGTLAVARADEAEAKTCKAGKVFNPDSGKCETVRGS